MDFVDDLLPKLIKINLKSPRLDLPDHDRLSNRRCFLLLSDFTRLCLKIFLCLNVCLIFVAEQVHIGVIVHLASALIVQAYVGTRELAGVKGCPECVQEFAPPFKGCPHI